MKKYGVNHHIATAHHPQMSGQVKVTNHELKRILEKTVHHNRSDWSKRLEYTIWAYRTSYKTSTRHTPYCLVYGKACHLLVKMEHQAYLAIKLLNLNMGYAQRKRKYQLNELEEHRLNVFQNSLLYKEKIRRIHDDHLRKYKQFQVREPVVLFNSRLKLFPGKFKSHWSGQLNWFCWLSRRRRGFTLEFFKASTSWARPCLCPWFSLFPKSEVFWGEHGLSTIAPYRWA